MFSWIKQHKLTTLLLVIVLYFVFNQVIFSFLGINLLNYTSKVSAPSYTGSSQSYESSGAIGYMAAPSMLKSYPSQDYTPQPQIKDRLVIQNSNLSLLVKNVVEVRNKIIDFAQNNGGYMVSAEVSNPQDAPTATVVVRIASDRLNQALDYFHSLAIKVVSENLQGTDVTDQFVDIEANIKILETTKARFESILAQAQEVSDIVNLNQQIINIQSQIDSYKGQQDALQKNAQLAKITLYISTDEIALPYAPSETFRPEVIFKQAVRSLVSNLRQIAALLVWVAVFAVLWLPLLLLALFLRKWWKKRNIVKP